MAIYLLVGIALGFLYAMTVGYLMTGLNPNTTTFLPNPKAEVVIPVFLGIVFAWPAMFIGILGFVAGTFINYSKVK
jgi:hypothetical protein